MIESVRGKEKATKEKHEVVAVMQQASPKSNRIDWKLLLKSPNKQLIPHRCSVHTKRNINKYYFHIISFDVQCNSNMEDGNSIEWRKSSKMRVSKRNRDEEI